MKTLGQILDTIDGPQVKTVLDDYPMKKAIEAYVAKVQELNNENHTKYYPNTVAPQVSIQYGKRYAKIVLNNPGTCVHSFVNMQNGDILMAASWRSPAKGARGNISDLTKGFNAYSADYWR